MNSLKVFKLYHKCIHSMNILSPPMTTKCFVRTLLSQSYNCDNQWEARLDNDLLSKINAQSFFNELNQRYQKKLRVTAVDIDLFANSVTREEQLEELQHLVFQLRRTKETVNTLDSTHHSFCRIFLKYRQTEQLVKIISNRIGFGIFPDQFCYNMILDQLIEDKNVRNAAKVSTLMMAQEEEGTSLSQILSLYAVHKYINGNYDKNEWFNSEELERLTKESELYPNACTDRAVITTDDNDEEVRYIRVPYIRNEYFDDHFDLRDPNHLCGKTLYFFSQKFDDIVGRSYQIIGLILYEKWDKCLHLLEVLSKNKQNVIVKEVVDRVDQLINSISEENSDKQKLLDIKKVLNDMSSGSQIVDQNLDELVSEKLKHIKDLEKQDMQLMTKLFIDWENERQLALNKQIEELFREEKKREIEEKKRELQMTSRKVYFFENFTKHEMDFSEAERKIQELKAKTVVEEDYIPPETY
ncbi:uncharacterized protein LOC128958377 [Oppia nitens]|uniref:uncharacterized protein LOC128958377 n=1 Tax=Oppia nitens TaxID=1686743 RepID=UPI0023D98332|nr:uncharacterized protein LOC128958377 [Oppia nitens]